MENQMNQEKIKLLSQQALDSVSNKRTVSGQLERTWNPAAYDQAFAQLIVRECAAVAVDLGCGDFVDIRQKLFDHFALPHTDVQTSWPDNPLEG